MASIELFTEERKYVWWPFIGLGALVPEIKIGDGDWQELTLDEDYVPDPVVAGATWWRVLIAGSHVTGNPVGTIVVNTASKVRFRVVGSPEIDIAAGQPEWVLPRT